VKLEQSYLLIKDTPLKTTTGTSYLWWLIGANHGRQVAPLYAVADASGDSFFIPHSKPLTPTPPYLPHSE